MDNKQLKTKILIWLCKRFKISSVTTLPDVPISHRVVVGKRKVKYHFLKTASSDKSSATYVLANDYFKKVNANNACKTILELHQILDIFLDESKNGYDIYAVQASTDANGNENLHFEIFIKRNSSLESLAIEMDLNSNG